MYAHTNKFTRDRYPWGNGGLIVFLLIWVYTSLYGQTIPQYVDLRQRVWSRVESIIANTNWPYIVLVLQWSYEIEIDSEGWQLQIGRINWPNTRVLFQSIPDGIRYICRQTCKHGGHAYPCNSNIHRLNMIISPCPIIQADCNLPYISRSSRPMYTNDRPIIMPYLVKKKCFHLRSV